MTLIATLHTTSPSRGKASNSRPNSQPTSTPCSSSYPSKPQIQNHTNLQNNDQTSHHLRTLSTSPTLHTLRLRRARLLLPLSLTSPSRPSLTDLIRRSIFLTNTALISRKLARKLASIHLARRLAARPSAEQLVERCVLPAECIPHSSRTGTSGTRKKVVVVAPALVAKKRAVERERVKDGLRGWIGEVWMGRVKEREGKVRKEEEERGVGRVWRLRKFW